MKHILIMPTYCVGLLKEKLPEGGGVGSFCAAYLQQSKNTEEKATVASMTFAYLNVLSFQWAKCVHTQKESILTATFNKTHQPDVALAVPGQLVWAEEIGWDLRRAAGTDKVGLPRQRVKRRRLRWFTSLIGMPLGRSPSGAQACQERRSAAR